MATDQNNMTGQSGMNNGSSGYGGMSGQMQGGTAMRVSRMMQNGMGEESSLERRRAKKEYRAKMEMYRAKHERAKSVFEQITGKSPETRKEAEDLFEMILARGTNAERSRATFAVGDFCWACDEKEAEKFVREKVDDFDTDED